jgi:hypothetical protein
MEKGKRSRLAEEYKNKICGKRILGNGGRQYSYEGLCVWKERIIRLKLKEH